MILVDSNVLLDLLIEDSPWQSWSVRQLRMAALGDDVAINDVIYAELSVGFDRIEDLDAVLEELDVNVANIPRPALFLAAKTHLLYRRRGGTKTNVLPDFFIGAHAAVLGIPLLTRDSQRYRRYFNTLTLIAPE